MGSNPKIKNELKYFLTNAYIFFFYFYTINSNYCLKLKSDILNNYFLQNRTPQRKVSKIINIILEKRILTQIHQRTFLISDFIIYSITINSNIEEFKKSNNRACHGISYRNTSHFYMFLVFFIALMITLCKINKS